MAEECNGILIIKLFLLFIPVFVFGQNTNNYENKGLCLKAQSLNLYYIYDGESGYNSAYELNENTKINELNVEANYFVNEYFAYGIGAGIGKLTQPKIQYTSLYANMLAVFYTTKNSTFITLKYGTHLGDLDKNGYLLRTGIGYRIRTYKNFILNLEVDYSKQYFYKQFEGSNRPYSPYTLKTIGFTIGVAFNKYKKI